MGQFMIHTLQYLANRFQPCLAGTLWLKDFRGLIMNLSGVNHFFRPVKWLIPEELEDLYPPKIITVTFKGSNNFPYIRFYKT